MEEEVLLVETRGAAYQLLPERVERRDPTRAAEEGEQAVVVDEPGHASSLGGLDET